MDHFVSTHTHTQSLKKSFFFFRKFILLSLFKQLLYEHIFDPTLLYENKKGNRLKWNMYIK